MPNIISLIELIRNIQFSTALEQKQYEFIYWHELCWYRTVAVSGWFPYTFDFEKTLQIKELTVINYTISPACTNHTCSIFYIILDN